MSGDDSADEAYGLIQKELFVQRSTRHIDLNTVPLDGNEYIHISRLENAKLGSNRMEVEYELPEENEQKVMRRRARREAVEFSYYASALACEEERLFLKQKFRKKLTFPNNRPACIQEWCTFCLGSKLCSKIYNESYDEPNEEIEGHLPLLSVVVHFNQYRTYTVLKYLHEWFLSVGMEDSLGSWIYALLACIRMPLDPSSEELIETFYNSCEKRLKDCDESEERSRLYLISTILESYFHANSD